VSTERKVPHHGAAAPPPAGFQAPGPPGSRSSMLEVHAFRSRRSDDSIKMGEIPKSVRWNRAHPGGEESSPRRLNRFGARRGVTESARLSSRCC